MLNRKVEKKIQPKFYQQVIDGDKKFEFRNDEYLYDINTEIILKEFIPEVGYTGRACLVIVTSKTTHDDFEAVPVGWCILSIKLIGEFKSIVPRNVVKEVLC